MSSAASPSVATFVSSPGTIAWSDGTLFDGYVWLGLQLPTGDAPYLFNSTRPQQLPPYTRIPIIGGQLDNNTGVFYNSNLQPPGTRYVAYYFDSNNVLIAPASGTATPFAVSATPVTLTVPTLTVPALGTAPVPQS